jgi:CheY-like chemotaxis protein
MSSSVISAARSEQLPNAGGDAALATATREAFRNLAHASGGRFQRRGSPAVSPMRQYLDCDAWLRVSDDSGRIVRWEALRAEVADHFHPDRALVDIGVPGMDGYEVARRLRAAPEHSNLFLVAMTGYGEAEDSERAYAAGFNIHLVKPGDPDQLQDLLASGATQRETPRTRIRRPELPFRCALETMRNTLGRAARVLSICQSTHRSHAKSVATEALRSHSSVSAPIWVDSTAPTVPPRFQRFVHRFGLCDTLEWQ